MHSLRELFLDELKDLWSAETQIRNALPKLAAAAHSPELKESFEQHLQVTQKQLERLDQIFSELQEEGTGKPCEAMSGLLREGEEVIRKQSDEREAAVTDAALIAAAQRVEHYEISAYGSAIEHARLLGFERFAELLHETLDEEKQTDCDLTKLARKRINSAALAEQ